MRRLQAYLMGSVTLATFVVTYAALERPNFYSASVYLSQSNFSLMVLSNFALVLAGSIMYTLQSLLFGPLRPLETEQLWERGWFAMMEWVFAMSTFRDEFGVWFLTMFISLFAGKIWGWIAEGRVEHLEQQAPSDTTLLHGRLLASLGIYVAFAAWMFNYCLDVVVLEARPGMTIMFVFEFAILCVSAVTACARYAIWAQEHRITRMQVAQAMEARKAEIRKERRDAEEKIAANPEAEDRPRLEDLPREEDVDENEIEAPGWEAKRGWVFALDIVSDLLKLIAYMAFFTILTVFYGIPIYIIRDLYMTMRSFTKRITDYLRFQAATRDMDTRYPNATATDLAADNTCIVCREEMRPVPEGGNAPGGGPVGAAMAQRLKPKKLPCGHILHFGCLSSWLERQQACPICRRSVFAAGTGPVGAAGVPGAPGGAAGAHAPNLNVPRGAGAAQPAVNRGRVFNLGPLRIQFGGQLQGRHNDQELLNALGRLAQNHRQAQQQRLENGGPVQPGAAVATGGAPGTDATAASNSVTDPANSDIHPGIRSAAARMALNTIETQIQREIQALNVQGQRAATIRNLLNELDRARGVPVPPSTLTAGRQQPQQRAVVTPGSLIPGGLAPFNLTPTPFGAPQGLQYNQATFPFARAPEGQTNAPPPPGVIVPQGWTLTPLNPIAESSASAPQIPQMLQNLLSNSSLSAPQQARQNSEASSSRTATNQNQLNGVNPLAQFFANSSLGMNGPHPHPHLQPQATSQGPFQPPPPPAAATTSTGDTPPSSTSQDITPTNSNPSSLPATASPLASGALDRTVGGGVDGDVPPPPTNVAGGWSFPPANPAVPMDEGGSGKGKAPARSVPETVVEPPTPVQGSSGRQASVEDAEGEDEG